MKVTIHRGAETIGGNCIELQSGNSRILLDYGAPLPKIDPDTKKSVQATPEETILDIPGLYEKSAVPIDGVIISHTHQDHYGGLLPKPISQDIPVFMTEAMEAIIRLTIKMPRDAQELKAKILPFKNGAPFSVGAFKLTPYLMDHSASEAFAFLVEAEGKKVIYTGDYREHGNKEGAFKQFLAADMGQVDLLITEGTQAGVPSGPTERAVMADIEGLVKGRSGALYVMCSGQNIDLLSSLAGIAERNGRYLVADGYVALVLETLKDLVRKQTGTVLQIPALDKPYFKIIDNNATKKISHLKEYSEVYNRMRPNMVDWSWVGANIDKLIIPVRTYSQSWVDKEIKDFTGALFVYSMWEGYREEQGFQDTLEYFKSRGMPEFKIHASGHAYFSTIRKLVDNKKPRLILPVHTERPENFVWAFGDRVKILNNGGSLEI